MFKDLSESGDDPQDVLIQGSLESLSCPSGKLQNAISVALVTEPVAQSGGSEGT